MADRKDGGQAFPRAGFSGVGGFGRPVEGMSLRDYFAGQALAGHIASEGEGADFILYASAAYKWADAMIAARDKP